MGIACLGISYKTATVQVREKCAFSGSARDSVLSGFAAGKFQSLSGLTELVLISTCNRVELYAVGNESLIESRSIHDALHSFLTEWHRLEAGELQPCLVSLSDESAVRHLCTVAAGLDSMVLGEAEILGQVGGALEASMRNGAIGPVLTTMFRTAIRVGRRIRSETSFGRNPASVSSVAVHLAEQIRQETGGRKVLLVGAGKMGSRAAEVLKSRGDWEIVVASRTLERAADVAQSRAGGCEALSLESLQDAIAAADIVITSTGAPHLIVTRDMVQKAVASRGGRSLAFIDVALPRDVEETVRLVPGVRVFDIDDLKGLVRSLVSEQRKEIPHAEVIMREEMDDFAEWLNGRALAPVLTGLRRHAEDIRQRELARTMRYLTDLDPEAREHIERFSRSLVSKLLHEPTQYLRSQAGQGQSSEYMDMARRLFGLTVSGGAAGPEQAATPTELS